MRRWVCSHPSMVDLPKDSIHWTWLRPATYWMSFDPGAERLHSLRTAIISLAASPCRTWRQKLTALRANQEVVLGQTIRIDDLVDDQKIGWFNLNLLFWLFLALFADGYDISVMPFAMPTLSKLWHVDAGYQSYVFTAILIGMLAGSPLLGSIGDRYGRKVSILLVGALLPNVSKYSSIPVIAVKCLMG